MGGLDMRTIRYTGTGDSAVRLPTGTGPVPETEFTLLPRDVVTIAVDGPGKLADPAIRAGR